MYDVLIIGAGIVGTTLARELVKYNIKVLLVDMSNDVASGASKANSAIIHAGYDAEYGTLMGDLNVKGNHMYTALCNELAVSFERIGSFVCALDKEEIPALEALLNNGKKLAVPNIQIITRDEALAAEPNLNPAIVAALVAPSAGILMPWEVCIASAENAMDNGLELRLNEKVTAIDVEKNSFTVTTNNDFIKTKKIVNCAGVHSDTIAKLVDKESEFTISARRGQYYLLDKTSQSFVNKVLFPAPSKLGKGILVAPTIDGNIIVGPDAEDLPNTQRDNTATTASGLAYVKQSAQRLVPNIPFNTVITNFSGMRAQPSTGDFIVGESRIKGFYNAAGIKSPGLSSAPAIAKKLSEEIISSLGNVKENTSFNPIRRPRIVLEKLSHAEKEKLIKENPAYGNIICRCESISEGEIIDAIHRNAGATTINGVKRRARPGAGRCQGGFCGPRVLAILARELNVAPTEIRHETLDSYILTNSLDKR